MFVRLRRRGRGLHENFLGCGLLGGVALFFFCGEGDHISGAAVLSVHGAALGAHGDSFPATSKLLLVVEGQGPHVFGTRPSVNVRGKP